MLICSAKYQKKNNFKESFETDENYSTSIKIIQNYNKFFTYIGIHIYIEIITVQSYSCKKIYSMGALLFANAFKKENVLIFVVSRECTLRPRISCNTNIRPSFVHRDRSFVFHRRRRKANQRAPTDGLIKKITFSSAKHQRGIAFFLILPCTRPYGCMTVICSKLPLVTSGDPLTKYVRTLLLLISLRQAKRQQKEKRDDKRDKKELKKTLI